MVDICTRKALGQGCFIWSSLRTWFDRLSMVQYCWSKMRLPSVREALTSAHIACSLYACVATSSFSVLDLFLLFSLVCVLLLFHIWTPFVKEYAYVCTCTMNTRLFTLFFLFKSEKINYVIDGHHHQFFASSFCVHGWLKELMKKYDTSPFSLKQRGRVKEKK